MDPSFRRDSGFRHSDGAAAQTVSSTTGAINGKVTDESDAALPGVTITISSPSMQGTRNTVSGGDGTFRFPAIAPGDTG